MKNLFILFALLTLLFTYGCSEEDMLTPELTLTSMATKQFDSDGGIGYISYSLKNPIEGKNILAKTDASWIKEINTTRRGLVSFVVSKNEASTSRQTTISITYDSQSFSVCIHQDEQTPQVDNGENDDSNTDDEDNGDDEEGDSGALLVQVPKGDNPSIYASGGSITLQAITQKQWQAEIINPESCDWLLISQSDNSLTITTTPNTTQNDRVAKISITADSEKQTLAIRQRRDIIQRKVINRRNVYSQLNLYYSQNVLARVVALLPVPSTNIYQDIEKLDTSNGTLLTASDNKTRYLRVLLNNDQIPASGECILKETFTVTNYSIDVAFGAITSQIDIDTDSEVYKKYTGANGDIIVPDLNALQPITSELWDTAKGNIVEYARLCYEYVARNMKYINPNTGLHPLKDILAMGGGDCGNQATVFISMLRNKGIPARHVVMIRPNQTYHVRAEFFLAGYGWIPVDPNAKNMNPSGDYFGKIFSDEIVLNTDINIPLLGPEDDNPTTILLFQTYHWWYWIYAETMIQIKHSFGLLFI